ncbi:MAG TPA: Ig-like domain-containing protein [Saprospiraceae bacterium]|nr:Ig-like domain-containing protein [Saprospiraceae bacterium]
MKSILIFICLLSVKTLINAQTVPSPTQTDAIIIDNGTPGSADPNDRIRYTVTVMNTGGSTATMTQLNAVPDARTTLVAGSFRTSPLAANDLYLVTGNVGITVPAGAGVKLNDYDDAIASATLSCGACTTANGGTVVLNNDGSFTYNPPMGFTGSDNINYTMTDGNPVGLPVPLTDVATITFTVSNMIWFIDNTAGGTGGTGTLANPFRTINDFNVSTGPAAGHTAFLRNTGTNYTQGIVLENNMFFFGTGHSGPGTTLADVLPFTLAPNSPALPAIAGTRPIITNTAAGGIGITLASGNTIRGVEVQNTTAAKISGTNFGTLTIGNTTTPDVLLGGPGQALSLTTGVFAATSKFVSITSTSSTAQGINLAGVSGTVSFGSTTISGSTTQGILIGTTTATMDLGNTSVTGGTDAISFQNNSSGTKTLGTLTTSGNSAVGFLHGAGGGPVSVTGATSITNPVGTGIDIQNSVSPVSFAGTTVSKSGAGIGVNLGGAASGNTGATTFNSLAITTANGAGLVGTNNAGAINVTTNAGSISATTGAAINISRSSSTTPVALNFTNVSSSASPNNGVALTNLTGNFDATGGTITTAVGTAFLVSGGSIVINYAGAITGNSALAVDIDNHDSGNITFKTGNLTSTTQGVRVQNCGGGTIAFENPSKSLNTGANGAVNLATNAGAFINFTGGGLVLTTTTGLGFNATGGGTITVTGTTNTISSGSGGAMNVVSTTIGGGNLNFLSISCNGASNGIVLNATGTGAGDGGLSVTGTGTTNGSGGTIQNITNRGVSVTTSKNLTLKNMIFNDANTADASPCISTDNSGCNAAIHLNTVTTAVLDNVDIDDTEQQGINLREVSGFTLTGSTVINGGNEVEEADIYAINLSGTCAFNSSSITVGAERCALIYNTGKTMALTVNGSTFGNNQTQAFGADGLEINSYTTSNTTIDIINSTFTTVKTNGLQVIGENTSFTSVDISGSTFDPGPGLAAAMDLDVIGTAVMQFNVQNNPLIKSAGINCINVFAFPDATFEGRINNNTVVVAPGSGIGIRVIKQGNNNCKVEIKNNNVSGPTADYGIFAQAVLGTGRLDAIITGNTVAVSNAAAYHIAVNAGASSSTFTNVVCAHIAGNITTSGTPIGNAQYRAATASHTLLVQGPGPPAATNWNSNGNTPMSPPAVISQSGLGIFTFNQTCSIPANPILTP